MSFANGFWVYQGTIEPAPNAVNRIIMVSWSGDEPGSENYNIPIGDPVEIQLPPDSDVNIVVIAQNALGNSPPSDIYTLHTLPIPEEPFTVPDKPVILGFVPVRFVR